MVLTYPCLQTRPEPGLGTEQSMHEPVLLEAVVELLNIRPGGVYVDATLGGGGHAQAILERLQGSGFLLALDRDAAALDRARPRLAGVRADGWTVAQSNFADLADAAAAHGVMAADGILFDLGMSSDQVDAAERGFSFLRDGPLEMRMDARQACTAAILVNELPEDELADLIYEYGEEPAARRIAAAVARARARAPIRGTAELAGIVQAACGGRHGRTHPATRTFQALRIVVNDELESLVRGLDAAVRLLRPGGRLAVIAFHSLEDRRVKQFMAAHVGHWEALEGGGARRVGAWPALQRVTRKPMTAGAAEIERNPRSRSAKLRVAERSPDEQPAAR